MIKIYAFCGMGKTTLCQKYGYIDDDMHYPTRPKFKDSDIVLTNEPSSDCDAYFIPPCFNKSFNKLEPHKQKYFNELGDLLKTQYQTVKEQFNPTIKEYITKEDIDKIIQKKESEIT